MSPPGCQKMSAKPCNRNAAESFPVLSLKSREQKPPNPLLIQDKNVLQPRSDLFVDELVFFVLLWLCVILLSYLGRDARLTACLTTPTLDVPPLKRTRVPKPFPGLLHKPHCADCEQALKTPVVSSPPAPPPQMISTRGRRRVVDTSAHFCPQPSCAY